MCSQRGADLSHITVFQKFIFPHQYTNQIVLHCASIVDTFTQPGITPYLLKEIELTATTQVRLVVTLYRLSNCLPHWPRTRVYVGVVV